MVLRRWGEYAFIRPGREMLFSRLDKESKYKAKNFSTWPCTASPTPVFAQIRKLLEAVGMGGTAQALTCQARAPRALGHQRLVARPHASRRKSTRIAVGRVESVQRRELPSSRRLRHAAAIMPSSVIRSYHYDPVERRSTCVFVSGRRYRYHDVPGRNLRRRCAAPFPRASSSTTHIRDQLSLHTRVLK